MGSRWRLAGLAAILVAGVACSGSSGPASPVPVPLPRISGADSSALRAHKLARYIERRWPRIQIERAHANIDGSVVGFNDLASFDASIRDPSTYTRHVARLTGDLDQASVELLKLAVRYFPNLRYATVWQDRQLQAFWTKEAIVAMDRPENYRSYRSFLRLIFTASYPPSGDPPPPPAS
jgi:hypothetical protein